MEATYINHNFSQQCLRMGRERYNFPNPNPFVEDDMDKNEIASVAYRYRRWKLGDDIDLIVRCEHDGVMTGANGEVSFINIKTLNEWDSRVRHHYSCVPAVCSGVGSWVLTQPLWVQGYLKFPSLPTE